MYIPEIIEVKDHLEILKNNSLIEDWELPYEDILTRRSAAIFFIKLKEENLPDLTTELGKYENFSYRANVELQLSSLPYRITFSPEEKEKNQAVFQ